MLVRKISIIYVVSCYGLLTEDNYDVYATLQIKTFYKRGLSSPEIAKVVSGNPSTKKNIQVTVVCRCGGGLPLNATVYRHLATMILVKSKLITQISLN